MVPTLVLLCLLLAAAVVVLALSRKTIRDAQRAELSAQREDSQRRIKAARDEWDRLLNALDDAFLLIDGTGVVTFANQSARRLFPGREVLNRRLDEVILEERLANPVREALRSGRGIAREVILPQQASPLGASDKRGETAWVVDAAPIDQDKPGEGVRVTIRDRTNEFQTDQVRKDFVANASHELRTPLAIINGYIENLLEEDLVEDTAASRKFLGIMQKHGERLSRIVEDMLVISRLESGEASALNEEPFLLRTCVQDVLERLDSVITAQAATMKVQHPDPELTVRGDRFYWTQVMFNLVENALKQNPRIPLKVKIGFEKTEKGELRIWVSDNGVGIPSSDLPFIFRRFYRVEKHHSQGEIKGTGLGLSIVKRAVEAHAGTIGVSSTPGQETRFEMILPASRLCSPEDLRREEENEPNVPESAAARQA